LCILRGTCQVSAAVGIKASFVSGGDFDRILGNFPKPIEVKYIFLIREVYQKLRLANLVIFMFLKDF